MTYLIQGKNLCRCHNAPPPSTIIKGTKAMTLDRRKFYFKTVGGAMSSYRGKSPLIHFILD
jgi:hypothetical protein